VAAWDAALALVASLATAYVFATIELARGQLDSGVGTILLAAAGGVLVRHLIRFALRPAN